MIYGDLYIRTTFGVIMYYNSVHVNYIVNERECTYSQGRTFNNFGRAAEQVLFWGG